MQNLLNPGTCTAPTRFEVGRVLLAAWSQSDLDR